MANTAEKTLPADQDNFAALLEESFGSMNTLEGRVVKGKVLAVDRDYVLIDVGLKSEGRVPLREFQIAGVQEELRAGDDIDVYLDRMEDRHGEIVLSREKARREAVWDQLEVAHTQNEKVVGIIYSRVKGGFTVDLSGVVAFLPGSQLDVRPLRDIHSLMNIQQPFMILKVDRARGNIVVSRRAILEESQAEARQEIVGKIEEGATLKGIVKNITDYGAFIDLGGVDGLLHVTDISWTRVGHPSEALHVGQQLDVKVIRFDAETQRISLGLKQLSSDPWKGIQDRYRVGERFSGKITNITDYGAFVELEHGVEGLVHVSEMSWTKKNLHPSKIVTQGSVVEVVVLESDPDKRRISLGVKQCSENPWISFAKNHKVGDELEGEIKSIADFGIFVGLPGDIDGMVHASDLSWEKSGEDALKDYKKGDMVRVKILDVDADKERVSLGVKQLASDPFASGIDGLKKGNVTTCTITKVLDGGLEVETATGVRGFIRRADLSRDRNDQRSDRFATDEKVDAMVLSIDHESRQVILSIKAREISEEKAAIAEFGSSDSGASLGDILGAAMNKAKKPKAEKADTAEKPAKAAKAPKATKAAKEK